MISFRNLVVSVIFYSVNLAISVYNASLYQPSNTVYFASQMKDCPVDHLTPGVALPIIVTLLLPYILSNNLSLYSPSS